MKKLFLIFLLAYLASANASSFTVARIGISQAHIRNPKLDKDSENTLTLGIGRRYYPWEASRFYWGFDLIYSQGKLTTEKVSFPAPSDFSGDTYVRIAHFDIKQKNIDLPILLGYANNASKKSSINFESGILVSLAYRMDYEYNLDDIILLADEERSKYNFDYVIDEEREPNLLSLNWLISASFRYRFLGAEFRYHRALNRIGEHTILTHQFIDSFFINMIFFF